tara:strand:- start:400 stop:624 length:225 start_codon:yes stop_codon:yes gene_type:complete
MKRLLIPLLTVLALPSLAGDLGAADLQQEEIRSVIADKDTFSENEMIPSRKDVYNVMCGIDFEVKKVTLKYKIY